MTSRSLDERLVLAGLLALFVSRAVIADATVPPWQGPDEPGHFALAYGLTMPLASQSSIEGAVLQSMVRHGWWDLYEDPPPADLTNFGFVAGIGVGTLAQPLYYSLAAAALKVSRPDGLEAAYVHLRWFSVLLGIATLALGWAGSRLLFGPEIAAGAAAIGALHPQFLLGAIAVNADALLYVCGALVWWQAARVITAHRPGFSAVMMVLAAVAALLTKRIGMVLVGVACVVGMAALVVDRARRVTRRNVMFVAVSGLVGASALLAADRLFTGQFQTWTSLWMDALTIRRPLEDASVGEAFTFVRMAVDYFWLIAGWLRFQPPPLWLWTARMLVLIGVAGAAIVTVEWRTKRDGLWMAWLFVVAHVMAMFFVVFWTIPSAPQARYLFPAFAPITVLLYIGLRRAIPLAVRQHSLAGLVVVLALMDITGFATVHVPTYIP